MPAYQSSNTAKAVNFHLTHRCNYQCGFCFSQALTTVEAGLDFWMQALDDLWELGIRKVNFVGGEPLLYKGLEDLCRRAKEIGYVTGIVSNGSLATPERLEAFSGILDCIGFSVDSMTEETECKVGRNCGGHRHLDGVREAAKAAHGLGFDVKLNITVVTDSADEDFTPLIEEIDPQRVKIFRVLKLDNVNSEGFDRFEVSDEQFALFKEKHENISLSNGRSPVFEDNDVMAGGYLMIDPSGRFMLESEGRQEYVPYGEGIKNLGNMIKTDRFMARGGNYFLDDLDQYAREPTNMRVGLYGISRSGKDYNIRDALEMMDGEYEHVSPIGLVHEFLGDSKLRNMSDSDKMELMSSVYGEIMRVRRNHSIITDEHHCFPVEHGGVKARNEYSPEKLPYRIVTDEESGKEYEVVFNEEDASTLTAAIYLKAPAETILERFRISDGWKRNEDITLEDVRDWQSFEIRSLKCFFDSREIPFLVIEGTDVGRELAEALTE